MTARSPTFDDVNTAALAAYPGLLSQWFPKGHLCGYEFCVGNLKGDKGESLSINIRTGVWSDFAEEHGGSDPVSLYAAINRLQQGEAKNRLAEELSLATDHNGARRQQRPSKPRSNGRRRRQKVIPEPELDDRTRTRIEMALSIWKDSEPAPGTVVEKYLHGRGIDVEIPPSIRFHRLLKYSPAGLYFPAMVAAVQALDQRITAIHRTFLWPNGRGKAQVSEPKMALGPLGDGAVRLAAAGPVLGIAEGVETGLSAMQLFQLPVWCALGSRLDRVALPRLVRKVVVLADTGPAGMEAAEKAVRAFVQRGRKASICVPHEGDFNDVARRAV